MNAKDAVTVAKAFYEDMFNERPTLEEIWFEDTEGAWCVVASSLGMRALNFTELRKERGLLPSDESN